MTDTPVLEPDELDALLGAINTGTPSGARNYALLRLMVHSGVRVGEALQVTLGDIRHEAWGNGEKVWTLRLPRRVTKGKKPRHVIPLDPATKAAVDAWLAKREALGVQGGPLFCTISKGTGKGLGGEVKLQPGQPLSSAYVRQLVARLAEKAGIGRHVHPHMLRHTALTNLYDRTQDLRLVQQIAGHSTSAVTERYTHVHPRKVAEAMGALEPEPKAADPATVELAQRLQALPEEQRKALAALIAGE